MHIHTIEIAFKDSDNQIQKLRSFFFWEDQENTIKFYKTKIIEWIHKKSDKKELIKMKWIDHIA